MKHRSLLLALLVLAPASLLLAQSAGTPASPTTSITQPTAGTISPAPVTDSAAPAAGKTAPTVEQLQRVGLAGTLAEAQPVLNRLADDREAHFQARLKAYQQMAGKTPDEKLKIWTGMLTAEKDRLSRIRENAHFVSEVAKQEAEKLHQAGKRPGS